MFAYFTRSAWIVTQPSFLIAVALLFGLLRLYRGQLPSARRWLLGATCAYFIAGYSSLSTLLVAGLENRFPRPDLSGAEIAGLIVLGGAEVSDVAAARNAIAVNDAAERYIETVMLARRFPKARIVFSGGGDVLTRGGETEAQSAARLFEALGLASDRITLEDRSRTTWENAAFTAPLLQAKPGERWLVVTSAWHMPRTMGAFRKVGANVEAYPVDYRTTGKFRPLQPHFNASEGLREFDTVVREYPGLLTYWLTGRTSALFPAP